MRAALFGDSWLGAGALTRLRARGVDVVAVFSHAPAGQPSGFAALAIDAASLGLAVVELPAHRRVDCAAGLGRLGADVLISAGFRAPLSGATLAVPRLGAFNLHPSLLPRYRGRSPVNWAVLSGERETGLTLHHMVEEVDAGDIVSQRRAPIGPDDTALEVIRRLESRIPELLDETLPLIASGRAPRRPQDSRQASVFGGRTAEDGRIDWRWPARRVHDLVRAITRPFPGAFAVRDGKRVFLWRTACREDVSAPPATGVPLAGGRFAIACGRGAVEVLRWSVEGGPERDGGELAAAWGPGPSI